MHKGLCVSSATNVTTHWERIASACFRLSLVIEACEYCCANAVESPPTSSHKHTYIHTDYTAHCRSVKCWHPFAGFSFLLPVGLCTLTLCKYFSACILDTQQLHTFQMQCFLWGYTYLRVGVCRNFALFLYFPGEIYLNVISKLSLVQLFRLYSNESWHN